jgi:hypothetical protein
MQRRTSVNDKKINNNSHLPVIHSQNPSFYQTIKQGAALSIGHRIVGYFMGPSESQTVIHRESVIYKNRKQEEYEQCLKEHNDRAVCERILLN